MTSLFGAFHSRLIGGALFSLAAVHVAQAAPEGKALDLTIDFAEVLTFDRPFTDIIIGNAGIADVLKRDTRSFVLTGKSAGTTNLIVLDAEGERIANYHVRVSSDVQQLTTIFFGSKRQTFSCAPTCEQVISVGDDPEKLAAASAQITGRTTFAKGQ